MKTVTIPTCANPFVVIVNGIKYTYPAGATVSVPDDVAAVIEQHDEAHNNPAPAPVVPPFTPATSAGDASDEVVDFTGVFDFYNSIVAGGAVQSVNYDCTTIIERLRKGAVKFKVKMVTMIIESYAFAVVVGSGEGTVATISILAESGGVLLWTNAQMNKSQIRYRCLQVNTQPFNPS